MLNKKLVILFLFLLLFSCGRDKHDSKALIPFHHALSPDGKYLSFVTLKVVPDRKNDIVLPKYNLLQLNLLNNKSISLSQDQTILNGPVWSNNSSKLFFPVLLFEQIPLDQTPSILIYMLNVKNGKTKMISPPNEIDKPYADLYLSISRTGKILFIRTSFNKIPSESYYGQVNNYNAELWTIDNNKHKKHYSGAIAKADWTYNDKICLLKIVDSKSKGNNSLYIVDPFTSREIKVLLNVTSFEVFKNKNAILIFRELGNGKTNISILNMETLQEQTIKETENFSYPSISKDSKQMCFTRGGDIWTLNLLTKKESKLTSNKSYKKYPIWTKDSKEVIYINESNSLWMVSADGQNHKQIFTLAEESKT